MSWIGVKGRSKDEVLASLGLADTGREVEPYSALFSCTELPSGWFIICSGEFDYATAEKVGELSARGFAVACQLEEHVMYSGARAFNNGAALWSVVHDPDVDRHGVTVEGEPPAAFEAIRERLTREQEEDDEVDFMFDVPIELAAALCGYRPDQVGPNGEDPVFTLLMRPLPPREPRREGPGWLARLFGARGGD